MVLLQIVQKQVLNLRYLGVEKCNINFLELLKLSLPISCATTVETTDAVMRGGYFALEWGASSQKYT